MRRSDVINRISNLSHEKMKLNKKIAQIEMDTHNCYSVLEEMSKRGLNKSGSAVPLDLILMD